MSRTFQPPIAWAFATLSLAPLGAVLYFFSEWLFFVTKPSMVASLPFGRQVVVLIQSPGPILPLLTGVQVLASGLSIVRYPRIRVVALVPPAVVGGLLLLVLVDNFTYTLLGFGVLTVGEPLRILYAALLPSLVALTGWKLHGMLRACLHCRNVQAASVILAAVLAVGAAIPRSVLYAQRDEGPVWPAAVPAAHSSALPNILFLGIDGVDAAALSAYGATRKTTPFLERVRDESLFFENAFANVGRTHGSLVALLTGRLPFTTRVTFPPTILQGEDAHRHLPGLLKPLGYTTLQLGMRHYADAEDANLLGFDAANYRWEQLEEIRARPAKDEVDAFRAELAERLDERVGRIFGFRHVIDGFAHVEGKRETPYWSDERRVETLERYFPTAAQPWFVHAHLLDTHCCSYHPRSVHFSGGSPNDDAHDSQLRETDDQVRHIFDSLTASGLMERTIVVISSDHTNAWTTNGRVPLMIRFPLQQHRGRVSTNVQLVDVAPTILAFLGISVPRWMDGESLLNGAGLSRSRLIFGVSEIAGRRPVTAFLTALSDAGPPNYGAGSVTMIAGSQWFELDLEAGTVESGPVAGHTAPNVRPLLVEGEARRLMLARLRSAGFTVGTQPQLASR